MPDFGIPPWDDNAQVRNDTWDDALRRAQADGERDAQLTQQGNTVAAQLRRARQADHEREVERERVRQIQAIFGTARPGAQPTHDNTPLRMFRRTAFDDPPIFRGGFERAYYRTTPSKPAAAPKQIPPKYEIRVVQDRQAYHVSLIDTANNDHVRDQWTVSSEAEANEAVVRFHEMSCTLRNVTNARVYINNRQRGHLTRDGRMAMRNVDGLEDTGEDQFGLDIPDSVDDVVEIPTPDTTIDWHVIDRGLDGIRVPF